MTTEEIYISVADDFSETPGARFREDGPFSAEQFMEEVLVPAFEQALKKGSVMILDLDRVKGYATSFLQGTFGTLAHDYGTEIVRGHLKYLTKDDPYLERYIERYINEANKVTKTPAAA